MKLFGSNTTIILALLVLTIFSSILFYTQQSYAQSSCATITTISTDQTTITPQQPFKCNVEVSPQFAGSETIACGISINGEFPTDFCPSDEFFGGWQGNRAQFNCVLPEKTLQKDIRVELVAYDFRAECGPETGKKTSLKVNLPEDLPTSSEKTDTAVLQIVRNLLAVLYKDRTEPPSNNTPTLFPSENNPSLLPSTNYNFPTLVNKRTDFSPVLQNLVRKCLANKTIYDQAATQTGVPWYVLAGIHYREGECGAQSSLVSGRRLGTNEPDLHGNCSSQYSGLGIPKPLPGGGCGFDNLLSTAIYAGNHLKGKIGKAPTTFPELTKALSYYNGGGNANCGKTPYNNCPRKFVGEDDTYVMNFFDTSHTPMYIVYCADYTLCNPAVRDTRPGTATAATILFNMFDQSN